MKATDPSPALALVDRLEKWAEQAREYAANNRTVADLLQPQKDLFDARFDNGGSYNGYAVQLAIEHFNSSKRDDRWADDVEQAARLIRELETLKGVPRHVT